jgi:hypothetical protein
MREKLLFFLGIVMVFAQAARVRIQPQRFLRGSFARSARSRRQ